MVPAAFLSRAGDASSRKTRAIGADSHFGGCNKVFQETWKAGLELARTSKKRLFRVNKV